MLGIRSLVPAAVMVLILAACSSQESPLPAAGGGSGAAGAGGSGGTAPLGPPYEVGPKQYGSYAGFDTQTTLDCTAVMSFVYYEPVGPGPFPIFVFTKGSRGEWDNDSLIHNEMLIRLAARGFVSASPDYQSNPEIYPGPYALTCQGFSEKARCIFAAQAAHPDSLIATLDRDTAADPSLGIITSGISQGGFLALLAADHNADVRGANPISIGTYCGTSHDLTGCVLPAGHTLAPERFRLANGESDATFGGLSNVECDGLQQIDPVWYRQQLNAMTALTCDTGPATYECFRSNGSGWVLARDSQVAGGLAHHAFPYSDYPSTADPSWASTAEPWGREANQAWLAGLVTGR